MIEIVYKSVKELVPYARNSRTHSDEQVAQIMASIKEFGFTNPVLTDGDNGIIAGHGRVMASQRLGMDEVPTIELSHLTEAQKKAYIIADNRIAENSGWNEEMLKVELAELEELNFDMDLTGFEKIDIDALFGDEENITSLNDLQKDLDNPYTQKIDAPTYEIKGEMPNTIELYNILKSNELIEDINNANIDDDIKKFLIVAAGRHTAFNYEAIAEFYAHQSSDIQNLMEKSALVIIDFNKAIENGFVMLSKNMNQILDDTQDEQ